MSAIGRVSLEILSAEVIKDTQNSSTATFAVQFLDTTK
jgi:hypothetical protein